MSQHEISEAEYDQRAARFFGRLASDARPAGVSEAAAPSATPWLEGGPFGAREVFTRETERLVQLESTRRGQTVEKVREAVESTLREAWFKPAGLGTRDDRLRSVAAALQEGIAGLAGVAPLAAGPAAAPTSETEYDQRSAQLFGRQVREATPAAEPRRSSFFTNSNPKG